MSMSCFDCHDYMDGYNRGKKEGTGDGGRCHGTAADERTRDRLHG